MRAPLAIALAAACAVGGALIASLRAAPVLDGPLFDLAVATRAALLAEPPAVEDAAVAVVAVDARSLASPELAPYPRALFGPVWARLIEELGEAGAKAIAFDFLLAYSGNALQPGYDRELLAALARWRERIVLGRSAGMLPARPYLAALRFDPAALAQLEMQADPDGAVRRMSPAVEADGERLPTLAAASLARAGGPEMPEEVLLAPSAHPERLPTYALIDVLRCADAPDALRKAFGGRILFIGTTLPEEDRKVSSARFLPPPEPAAAARSSGCALAPLGASASGSRTVPGVHLHALAADGVLRNGAPRRAPLWAPAIAAATAGAAGAAAGLALTPWAALAAIVLLGAAFWMAQTLLLDAGFHVPTGAALVALAGAAILAYVVRYLVEERRRRRIQRAFGRYLAPAVVDRLLEDEAALRLGGEEREVTVMFADLSGFTALSTKVPPAELVALTNEYLAIVAGEVDRTGGYVDKFIGDAVMAIWGAPAPERDHALRAVQAAQAAEAEIRRRREAAEAAGRRGFGVKIGLYSGPAVVGNVGSENRYNYTAVGETVNVASRLESLPGLYGCAIVLGATTAQALAGRLPLRELDRVAVKGRAEPLTIYEPGRDEPRYAEALAHYRARRFEEAEAIWSDLAAEDPPSAVMASRAAMFRAAPPPEEWAGVWTLATK